MRRVRCAVLCCAVLLCPFALPSQKLWRRSDLREDLQRSFKDYKEPQSVQTDVVHSQAFKEYCGNFVREPDHRNIVLMLYADGVSVATRRDSSMFVISAQVVNLPPDKRRLRDNILLLQIIPGPKTPSNISGLLQPLVDELHVTGWWHHLSCDGLRCISLRICMLCICLCFRGRVCGHARHAVERCRAAVATVC